MDSSLRLQVLRAAVRDRQFLKSCAKDINPEDFPELEEEIVIKAAISFWDKYNDPISPFLRVEAEELARKAKASQEVKKKLRTLIDTILLQKLEQVSVKALEDRVKAIKERAFYEHAVDEILTAHEKEAFTADVLVSLFEKAQKQLVQSGVEARDYFKGLEKRIERRLFDSNNNKFPLLFIDPLDRKIRLIGRKHLGLFLAPYKAGKSLALIHTAGAYSLQGLNILYLTLEDTIEETENRFDSSLTGIPLNKLSLLPNRLRKRFRRVIKSMRGRIRIIDGTDGGWTVPRIERLWHQLKQEGFTADCIIIDYDDELESTGAYKGESQRRMQFAEIYRDLRRLASRLDIIIWTAAQAKRVGNKKVVSGDDTAEDISKIRKTFLAIGIGSDGKDQNKKHLYVAASKLDRSHFGVDICTDFNSAIFYDRDATMRMQRIQARKARKG